MHINTDRYQIKTRYNKQWNQSTMWLSELQVTKDNCIRTKQRAKLWRTRHIVFSTAGSKNNQTHSISQQMNSGYVLFVGSQYLQTHYLNSYKYVRLNITHHFSPNSQYTTARHSQSLPVFLHSGSSPLSSVTLAQALFWLLEDSETDLPVNKLKHNIQSAWNYCFVYKCSLECDAMRCGRNLPKFRLRILLPYSG